LIGTERGVVAEAGHTLVDVRAPTRFRELAVVDDVHASFFLPTNNVVDRGAERSGVGVFVDGLALSTGGVEGRNLGRTDQATGVGGQNALFAALHGRTQSYMAPPSPWHTERR
jgi:hypothetical protein